MTEAERALLLERYEALLQAARSVYALHTLDDLIEQVLKHSLRIMQVEACSLYLPDRKTQELIIYSARGREDADINCVRIPWQVGIAGSVFQKKEYERIDDVQNDPRFNRDFDKRNGFNTRAMLCFPLLDGETCVGVLQCINPLHHPLFHEVDEKVFEAQARILTSALLRLEREDKAAAEAKLAQELALASEIQKSFLPPAIFIEGHAEFHVHYQPARTIGGDFYAALPLSRNRYLIATGDVSGKGIPAALTTAQVTGQLSVLATVTNCGLSELVRLLNHSLYGRLAAGRFVATTFLLYDPEQAQMEVCCAGQFTPWRWNENSDQWQPVEVPRGLPLGVFPSFAYRAETFTCSPGEKWVMFSDGINEGRSATGEEYGMERFAASLKPGSPRRTLSLAWQSWSAFADTDDLHDDACLTVFGCRPAHTLNLLSSPAQCKRCRQFVESWTRYVGFDDLTRGQIQLAVDEAITNIMRHTYQQREGEKIDITVELDEQYLTFRLRDYGPTLDPNKLQKKELSDVRPGGLGLPLLDMTFTTVRFLPHEPGNELVLSKPTP